MKKLDLLILKAYIGPFFLALLSVLFIFLLGQTYKYLEVITGKGLGIEVISELLFYFCIILTPRVIPLAVLVSSLLTFGGLGEYSELIAIKSAGISLNRVLIPVFIFVLLLSAGMFYFENHIVTKAELNSYGLLYDIQQKQPALNIKEGVFYNGIPNYSIKVQKKDPNGIGMRGLIIYEYDDDLGYTNITIADSGTMQTFMDERFLKVELFNGSNYQEYSPESEKPGIIEGDLPMTRTSFEKVEMIFNLSNFELKRSDGGLFSSDRYTRNYWELEADIDSLHHEIVKIRLEPFKQYNEHFNDPLKNNRYLILPADLADNQDKVNREPTDISGSHGPVFLSPNAIKRINKQLRRPQFEMNALKNSLESTREMKRNFASINSRINYQSKQYRVFKMQKLKIIAQAVAVISMFLIGAPLGAIVKKGGLGMPILLSIMFFIIYYVISITGEKWIKSGLIEVWIGVWQANFLLIFMGLFFIRQAKKDARLFDPDYYQIVVLKIKRWFSRGQDQLEF